MIRNTDTYAKTFPFEQNYQTTIHPWFHENDGGAADRMAETLLRNVPERTRPISIGRSMKGSRRSPRVSQRMQSLTANLAGSLAISRLRSALQPVRRDKAFSPEEVTIALEGMCKVERIATPQVTRTRHPVTGMPLTTVVCRAQ
jgi:hypothetical protein